MTDRKTDDSSDYVPSKIPFKCVICNGFGSLKYGELQCHGCKGKGYILIPTKEKEEEKNED